MKGLGWAMLATSGVGFLLAAGFDGWRLVHGYDIGFSLNGGPVSVEHVDFPGWRMLLQPVFVVAIIGWMVLRLSGRSIRGAGLALIVGIAAIAIWDFREYGLATPTPLTTVVLAGVACLLAAKLGPLRKPRATA